MDTDSNYMAISAEKLEDIVKPELQTEFEANKQEGEKNKFSTKGMSKKQRDHVAAFQVSFGRQQGHGNEHWFSREQWEDCYIRTAEAGAERLLRQTLGIGRRYSHRTD